MTQNQEATSKSSRISHVARASLLIAVFFTIDKLLGFVRQVIIGRQFGVSEELPAFDAFNAANNLPDLLVAVISGGALAIAFIPVLSSTLEREGREATWALFSHVANWAFTITTAIAVVLFIFADSIVQRIVAPGFTLEQQQLAVELMRFNLLATLLFSLSGLVSASLQSFQHFLLPALAPVVYDLGQIFGAIFLAPSEGYQIFGIELPTAGLGVHGLVYGVIIGALLHFVVQIPGLIRFHFRWFPLMGVGDPGLREVTRLMAPRILIMIAFQVTFVAQDNLASRLDVGSVTALVYGWLIMQVPETIIGTAIGIALLPTLSEYYARADGANFARSVSRAIRVMLALTIPIATILIVGIEPLIQGVFNFDEQVTQLVIWAARAYLLGLAGHSLLEIGARAFFARHNAIIPLFAAVISAVTFIIISILLFQPLGAAGIGLSNSIAFTIEAIVLIFLLARIYPLIIHQGRPLLRIIPGSLLAAVVTYLLLQVIPGPTLLVGAGAILGGSIVVFPFIRPELKMLKRL
ncbi:MAG: murein biosynthesis integral membrane protein MurJ [Anaerolineales bacterium]|nr:murein biosynthesis integral membrane protein MurJ [Anaerolineales bacterium]